MCPYTKHSGFTLIELSIVLVIIGLIIGGILVGRDLIHASEIRATITSVEKLTTAVHAFQLKYNCLPGDCPNATDFFGSYSGCPTSASFNNAVDRGTCNGNGDGTYIPWDSTTGGEAVYALDQLTSSGLIQHYADRFGLDILRAPGPVGMGFSMIYTNDLYANVGGDTPPSRGGNTVLLGGKSGGCGSGASVKVRDAQQIDTKMDDGHAASGMVYGMTGTELGLVFAGGCGDPIPTCRPSGDYNTTDETGACRIVFYW